MVDANCRRKSLATGVVWSGVLPLCDGDAPQENSRSQPVPKVISAYLNPFQPSSTLSLENTKTAQILHEGLRSARTRETTIFSHLALLHRSENLETECGVHTSRLWYCHSSGTSNIRVQSNIVQSSNTCHATICCDVHVCP